MSAQPALPEQARMELAMTAAAAERSNRPTRLVLGAFLLFLCALAYALMALGSKSAASLRATRAAGELANLRVVVADLKSAMQADSSDEFKPNTRIVASLREGATALGLPDPDFRTEESTTVKAEGFVYRRYSGKLIDQEPEVLLRWVRDATSGANRIAGLQLDSIALRPGRTLPPEPGHVVWNLDVIFSRWERKQ